MTHFMEWLYIHYIRPEIQQSDDSEYKEYFSLLTDRLTVDQRDARDRALEFYACNAMASCWACARGRVCTACSSEKTFSKVFLFDTFSLFTKKKYDR